MDSSVIPAPGHVPSTPNLPNPRPANPQLTSALQGTQPPISDDTLVPRKEKSTAEKPGALSHFVLKLRCLTNLLSKYLLSEATICPGLTSEEDNQLPTSAFKEQGQPHPVPSTVPFPGSSA